MFYVIGNISNIIKLSLIIFAGKKAFYEGNIRQEMVARTDEGPLLPNAGFRTRKQKYHVGLP